MTVLGLISSLFFVFIILMVLNIILTIVYAVHLIMEEKSMLGYVSKRRILESALTIVGALETGVWFFFIFLIWYLPYLLGMAVALGVGGVIAYLHSHGMPSTGVLVYSLVSVPLLLYVGYYLYGLAGVFAFLTIVVSSFIIALVIIDIMAQR